MRLAWRPYSSAYRAERSCRASGRAETKSARTSRSNGATESPARRIPSRWRRRNWQNRGGDGGFAARRVVRWMRHNSGCADTRRRFSSRPVHRVRTISRSDGWWSLDTSAPRSPADSSATTRLTRKASIGYSFYTMPTTDAPGFPMYYEAHGDGFPLLLVNGLGSDHREWLHQLPAFAARFRVVAFDNRGAGDSGVPPGPYTTAGMADDAAALLAVLGIGRTHVLGVSLGGMIAQELALRHPERVERLVLACTSPGGAVAARPSDEALSAFIRAPEGAPEEELRRTIPFLYTERFAREHPGEIDAFVARRLQHPTSPEGHASQLAAAIGHAAGDRLSAVRAATLVVTGTEDRLIPPVNSERIAQRIPGAKLVLLPGAPHRLFAECAEAFNREVLAFLGR